jgi:sortase A
VATGHLRRNAGTIQRLAVAFLVLGSLLLAFVAYQLWGTALYEHQAQDRLRIQLSGHLHRSPVAGEATSTSSGSRDTPTVGAVSPARSAATAATAATAAAGARAPAEGGPEGLLSIPRLGMNAAVFVEGVAESDLQEGPGHYPSTALPGQPGNVGIAGHRTTYGAPFYNLDQLQPGDPITVQVPQGTFTYDVVRASVVQPTNTSVLAPASLPVLTLTTCNPRYSASTRLVVTALLQQAKGVPPSTPDPSVAAVAAVTASSDRPATGGRHSAHQRPISLAGGSASSRGSVGDAVLFGELTLLLFFGVRILWRLVRNRARWGILTLGTPAVAVLLFVFFQHVSLALPASF